MSILLGNEIENEYVSGRIKIKPFNLEFLGPNSIDVTLNRKLLTYEPVAINYDNRCGFFVTKKIVDESVYLDLAKENPVYEIDIPEEGLILSPGILYLGCTNEIAGSDHYIPMYEGRSSMARLGIQSHISAGFGDIGFTSNWTLEITCIHPVKIYPNIRIGQVYFHKVQQESIQSLRDLGMIYKGKYSDQPTAQKSKSYLDFRIDGENVINNSHR